MPYYPTIEEDLARAKAILEKGRLPDWRLADTKEPVTGGVIYAGDIYAAYKLLESFVAEIERLRLSDEQAHKAVDWHRGMAERFAEDRDALKHENRRLNGEIERLQVGRQTLIAEIEHLMDDAERERERIMPRKTDEPGEVS